MFLIRVAKDPEIRIFGAILLEESQLERHDSVRKSSRKRAAVEAEDDYFVLFLVRAEIYIYTHEATQRSTAAQQSLSRLCCFPRHRLFAKFVYVI